MSKKNKKTTTLFDKVQDNILEVPPETPSTLKLMSLEPSEKTESEKPAENAIVDEKKQLAAGVEGLFQSTASVSKTDKQRLEDLDSFQAENLKLIEENSKLTDQLAASLEEIEQLKSKPAAEADITAFQTQIVKLEQTITALRSENDKLLVRISDLTFDNARLNASIQNLKQMQAQMTTQKLTVSEPVAKFERSISQPQPRRPVNVKSIHQKPNNGYSSWN